MEPRLDHTMNTRRDRELNRRSKFPSMGVTKYFNGLGFATGHFNALGKYQESEPMFTETLGLSDTPSLIDSSGVTMIGNQLVSFSGVEELSGPLDSGKLEECFARQFFRIVVVRKQKTRRSLLSILGCNSTLVYPWMSVLSRWCIQTLKKMNKDQGE